MKRFLTAKGLIGLTLIVLIFAVGVVAPFLIPAGFGTRMQMAFRLKPPTFAHPFGTDQLGRDLLYRVLLGARTSLTIAGAAVAMSVALGLPLGLVSGYFRGWLDNVLMRLVDTLLSFPALLLALTISAMLGPSASNTIIAIGVAFTPFLARIIRGEALRVAQMPYVEAARAAGTNDLWMIVRHVLPNVLPLVIVQGTISLAFAILAEAGLSFLGLGTQPPQSSWGLMIQASRDYLDVAPWTALVPGCAVALTVLGLNMFGDVLRDVLDPEVALMAVLVQSDPARDEGETADDARPIVAISNLRVEFDTDDGTVVGVENVGFAIQPGETLCVVGKSGSGKSVTALSLMRLVEFGGGRITSGHLAFARANGQTIDLAHADAATMRGIRGNEIGMVFQEPMTSLNPVFRVGQQLVDGLRAHKGLSREAARRRALALLQGVRIPEPERRLRQYPHELSGGMRQRVVIAMAMACEPRLLIADEPTTALDVTIQAEILGLIDRLKRENGMAVLFITHDMAVVAQMADRVVVMYRGSIVEEGPVEQIFASPREDYTKALLAAVPKLGAMGDKPAPALIPIAGAAPKAPAATVLARHRPLLDVRNLTTRFPVKSPILRRTVANVHAVEDVSFSILTSETLSLVGESGCGKSSCGRSILRLVEAVSGDIQLDGWDIRKLGSVDMRQARRDMQMIFQDPFASLNPYRRLGDQVAEPLQNFGLAHGSEMEDRVATLFDRVELPRSFLRRYPHELSGGQRQRVAVARALAPRPKLIIADECVSALDVSVQAQVLNLLMELQADLGLSFLFISHDMAVVERVSHHVAVMYFGRIVEIGPRAAVFQDPRHSYTKSLLQAVPVADPGRRRPYDDHAFRPLSSPIFPVGHAPERSTYEEAGPNHWVIETS